MSALKEKLASAASSPRTSLDVSTKDQEADKYRLLVTAGPGYDTSTHKIVRVNTSRPTIVSNDFLTASIKVRIRGYRGLPSSSPGSSPYFEDPVHSKDQYSIAFSFTPKVDLPSVDTIWGNDFDHPVRDRLPPGFNTAFRIVKEFIDPGLECDAYADEPWLYGPSLSCWFAFAIGGKDDANSLGKEREEVQDILREGADSDSGWKVRRELRVPDNSEKRRKHFLSRANREAFTFEAGRTYHTDFYNPYLDFGNFALKLPGFSIRVIKYIDEKSHRLRYVFKNRKTGDVYFCVNLNLLWGEELRSALEDEQKEVERLAGAEAETTEINGHSEEVANGVVDGAGSDQNPRQDAEIDENARPALSHPRPASHTGESEAQPSAPEPGLTDKPPHVLEQIKNVSIQDILQDTASNTKPSGKAGIFDDDVD